MFGSPQRPSDSNLAVLFIHFTGSMARNSAWLAADGSVHSSSVRSPSASTGDRSQAWAHRCAPVEGPVISMVCSTCMPTQHLAPPADSYMQPTLPTLHGCPLQAEQ
jgi:hypothetical protein